MQFITSATALLALAVSVIAQTDGFDPIWTPEKNEKIPAGSTYKITWSAEPAKYADGTVSISLIGGADQDHQVPLMDIATGVANKDESYSWAVDASLGAENVYGLVVKLESDPSIFQYSNPFHIKGDGSSTASGSATGSAITLTKSHGVKTVTLSSNTPTSTPETSTIANTTSCITSTTMANSTTFSTMKPSKTIITSTAIVEPSTTQPTTVPTETGAAARVGAGSMALLGGVAMAFLAL